MMERSQYVGITWKTCEPAQRFRVLARLGDPAFVTSNPELQYELSWRDASVAAEVKTVYVAGTRWPTMDGIPPITSTTILYDSVTGPVGGPKGRWMIAQYYDRTDAPTSLAPIPWVLVRVCAQCPRAAERRGELRSLATQLGVPDRERRVLARRVDCDGRGVWGCPTSMCACGSWVSSGSDEDTSDRLR